MSLTNATQVKLGLIDNSEEVTHSAFYLEALDATNFAAINTAAGVVRLAIEAITLLNETRMTATLELHSASPVPPTDHFAQRELNLRLYYVDSVGEKGYISIPGPDAALLNIGKHDVVDIATGAQMIALVIAVEADCKSRFGNSITVTGARLVGRNN